jgi:hypothetical protein
MFPPVMGLSRDILAVAVGRTIDSALALHIGHLHAFMETQICLICL